VINRRTFTQAGLASFAAAAVPLPVSEAGDTQMNLTVEKDQLRLFWKEGRGTWDLGQFVFADDVIRRPYFCNLCAGNKRGKLTRNHPLTKDDTQDHATMHSGAWLSFGDVSGHDFWRNKARVVHEGFKGKPAARGACDVDFTSIHRYDTADGKPLARETMVCTIRPLTSTATPGCAWRIAWDSTFEPLDQPLVFGDQEEMGLGVRLKRQLSIQKAADIIDSEGRTDVTKVWGQTADWCLYGKGGTGVVLMAHPDNFKKSRFHVRDYGLMVANPFADQAFGHSKEPTRTVVKPGEKLRLRFGLIAYVDLSGGYKGPAFSPADEYAKYVADPTK
jgi:hypothetical protein